MPDFGVDVIGVGVGKECGDDPDDDPAEPAAWAVLAGVAGDCVKGLGLGIGDKELLSQDTPGSVDSKSQEWSALGPGEFGPASNFDESLTKRVDIIGSEKDLLSTP